MPESAVANCYDILELLDESPTREIHVNFNSPEELETFRVKLYQTKKRNDEHLIGIGFIQEEDKKSLIFKKAPTKCSATIVQIARKEEVKYQITIVDTVR